MSDERRTELTLDCAKFPPDTVIFKVVDNDLHIITDGDGFDDGVVAVLGEDGQRQLRNFLIGIQWESGRAQLTATKGGEVKDE